MLCLISLQIMLKDIYSFDETQCASCLQVKSAALQLAGGVLQPLILAPISSFIFASRHFTFRMPLPFTEPLNFAKFYLKLSRPLAFPIAVICGLHVLTSFAVTHLELSDLRAAQLKMMKDVPLDAMPPKPRQQNIVETL